jgi:hypothetical protein
LSNGKNSDAPAGIVHCLVTEPPKVPTRNHTVPFWFEAHLSPVSSERGFWLLGKEYTHCHHFAPQSPYVTFSGRESGGATSDKTSAGLLVWAATVTIEPVVMTEKRVSKTTAGAASDIL